MFGFKMNVEVTELKKDIKFLQDSCDSLKKEKSTLKEELEDLKLKKRLEMEEIKHLTKINEERMKIEVEQEKVKLAKESAEKITVFKEEQRVQLVESLKDFHTKIEKRFGDELANLKEVYTLLMQRLPNVNLTLTKKV